MYSHSFANGSKAEDGHKTLFGADSGVITSHASYLSLFSMEGLCATVTGKEGISDIKMKSYSVYNFIYHQYLNEIRVVLILFVFYCNINLAVLLIKSIRNIRTHEHYQYKFHNTPGLKFISAVLLSLPKL